VVFLKTYDTYVFMANFMAWVCRGCSVNIQLDRDCIHRRLSLLTWPKQYVQFTSWKN